jgi:hypothetical protein
MITLTTPITVRSQLGSATTINYEKAVIGPFSMDPVRQTMQGTVTLTSTSTPTAEPIVGTFRASVPGSELVISVPQLNVTRRVVTSGAQNTAMLGQIQNAQNAIESGLISVGHIAGTQSTGV